MANVFNAYTSDKSSNSYININNCAMVSLSEEDYHIERKNGRSDYLLMYIARGRCYTTINGKDYVVKEKQAFLYHPNEPQKYHFLKEDKSIDYWIHFTGVESENIIASLGLQNSHHLIMNIDTFDVEQTLFRICHEFSQKQPFYQQVCSGLLITALSIISRAISTDIEINSPKNFINHIIGEFHSQPQKPFVVEELARKHSVSPDHLIRTFKKTTGMTPAQYMIDFRIKKAKELLLFSNYSTVEISEFIGYPNYSYFSRLFKKHTGKSPSQFRANKIF